MAMGRRGIEREKKKKRAGVFFLFILFITRRHSLYLKKRSSHLGVASPLRNFSEYHELKQPSYSCLICVHFSPMLEDMADFV
jgi:hypothetical protein